MRPLWPSTVSILVFFVCNTNVANGADFSAEDVVAAVSAATTSIENVECQFRVFHSGPSPAGSDIDVATGWGMGSEFNWAWQRGTSREAMRGMWSAPGNEAGTVSTNNWTMVYNGKVLKTFGHDSNAGEVAPVEYHFTNWVGPLILFGRDIAFDPTVRSLPELLEGATLIESEDAPSDVLVLRSEFEDSYQTYPLSELTLWVDPSKGFTPRRIEIRRKLTQQVFREYDVEDVKEVTPGIWFPIRGKSTFYYAAGEEVPEGVSMEDVAKMSPDELQEFATTRVKYDMRPLGKGTELYVTLPETIRVNHRIADELFEFEFPPGSHYVDKFTNEIVEVPGLPNASEVATPSPSSRSRIRNVFVIASLVVFCLVAVWWSRTRRVT